METNVAIFVRFLGGQDIIRPLWRHYYENTQGVIFVVDSNDVERVGGPDGNKEEASGKIGKQQENFYSPPIRSIINSGRA